MARVKWGGDFAESDIADYEPDERLGYDGPQPQKGMYNFVITKVEKGESQAGNPKVIVSLKLVSDGSGYQNKINGFTMKDFITVTKRTMFRLRPFLDALGITAREFMTATTVDEDDVVIKMGKVSFRNEVPIRAFIRQQRDNDEYMEVARYHAAKDEDADDDTDDDSDDDAGDDDGTEAPF